MSNLERLRLMKVFITKENRQWGPYAADQLGLLIENGAFALQDWAWIEGGTEWVPVSQILEVLQREREMEAAAMHQKVEAAKERWRSKLTSPVSGVHQSVVAQAVVQQHVAAASVEGSWWKQHFFYPALGLGIAGFVAMLVLGGPDEVEFNSLRHDNGVAFQPNSDRPFEGIAVLRHPDGSLKYEAEFRGGRPHGVVTSFFSDGSKKSESKMEYGKFHGKDVQYHTNGTMKSHSIFRKGNAVSRKNWDENGNMVPLDQGRP